MRSLVFSTRRVAAAALTAAALSVYATPTAAQQLASLNVSRIAHNGALAEHATATFRVTVHNTSQRTATPSNENVLVKLVVLDPDQKRTEYESTINGIGPRGNRTAAIPNVKLGKPGTYTVISYAAMPPVNGRADIRSADHTQTFTVGAARADGQFDLSVMLTNARGQRANGLRVRLLTADGQELSWKNSNGSGEARFPKLAPSPKDKPYVIEVRRGGQVLASEKYLMPAQASVFPIKLSN